MKRAPARKPERVMNFAGVRRPRVNRLPFERAHESARDSSGRLSARVALTFFLTYLFLGVLTPLQLFDGEAGHATAEFWFAFLILQWTSLRIAALASDYPRFLTMTFYFFVYIWVGWSGSVQIYLNAFPWPHVHTENDVFWALTLIALALAAYELGQAFGRRRDLVSGTFPRVAAAFEISFRRLIAVWAFSFVGFAWGVFYFGVDGVLGTRATFNAAIGAGTQQASIDLSRALLRIPCFVTFIATLYLAYNHWHALTRLKKQVVLAVLLTSAVVAAVANYPPAVARSWLGAIIMTPLFILLPWSRRAGLWWVLVLAFALMWAYPRADLFRRHATWGAAFKAMASQEAVKEHIFTVDYDVLQMSTNSYIYVENNSIMWGNNVLGAALFFVPRKLWPEKPQRTDLIVSRAINYKQNNLSVPFWSEMHIASGWVGLPLALYLYGFWSRRMDSSYIRIRTVNDARYFTPAALLVPFWAAYQFYFLRGNLMTAVAYSFLAVVLFIWVFRIVGRDAFRNASNPAVARVP